MVRKEIMSDGVAVRQPHQGHCGQPGVANRKSVWRFAPIAVVLAGLGFGYAMGWHHYLSLSYLADSRDSLQAYADANFVLSAAVFVGIYTMATACSFPAASILTIFSGFLFGWLLGGLFSVAGATMGATALFVAARSAFGDTLRKKAGGAIDRLAAGFEKDAFSYLLVLRLAPFLPFFLVNIAPAFFNVKLRTYVSATLIGILPGAFAYAWLGQGVDSVLVAARAAGGEASVRDLVTPEITIAFAAIALVAVLAVVVKHFWLRRAT